jgi:hypothetical protein
LEDLCPIQDFPIRYDLDTPRTERYNRMNFFDPDAPSPLASRVPQFPNLNGGVRFVEVDGNARSQYNTDTNNLAPRLGLAYQFNQKTVIRAGYSHIFWPVESGRPGQGRAVRVPHRIPMADDERQRPDAVQPAA